MSGEALEFIGSSIGLIGFILSVIVMAAILVSIDAGLLIWSLYILELVFLVGGAIIQGIGKSL